MGGMGGGKADTQTYPVAWKLANSLQPTMKEGLEVYWFPASDQEFKNSSLRQSRMLSLYSQQCVAMTRGRLYRAARAEICPQWQGAGSRAGAG